MSAVELVERTTKDKRHERLYRCANGWSVGARTELPALLRQDASKPWAAWLIDERGLPVPGSLRDFLTESDVEALVAGAAAYVAPVEPPARCVA